MRGAALGLTLLLAGAGGLRAQVAAPTADTTAAAAPRAIADSLRPPVSPMGAFWRSLLVPGWGQAANGRRVAGAIFMGVEGVALGMTVKADREVTELEEAGSGLVDGKREEREDWLVILAFNHLFSALEAFTAAHLWDFPGDLRVQRGPDGYAAGLTLPLPRP